MKKVITIIALSLVLSGSLIAKENKENLNSINIENEVWLKVEKDLRYSPEKFIEFNEELRRIEILTSEDSDKEIEKYINKTIYLHKHRNCKVLCNK